ncbi:MAG: glucosaminidase domain-containing protein [Clostridium sp.]|nr:glucosaminidase domain-containing protein [Clostridium sp.]MCM1444520.1 glucosaminidase domain-containing protein [Candidatus Amulumruptor caecigallinarius]
MGDIYYFKSARNKNILLLMHYTDDGVYKHVVDDFPLQEIINGSIKKLSFRNNKTLVYFEDRCIVLQDIKLLKNKELKPLYDIVRDYRKAKTILNLKKEFKLERMSVKGKIKMASAFTSAALIITTISIPDYKNNIDTNESQYQYNQILNQDIFKYLEESSTKKNIDKPNELFKPQKVEELPKITEEELIIQKYADIYFIDYNDARNYVSQNINDINESDTFEVGVMDCLSRYHWLDERIDKQPIMSNLTEEEKERFILEIANAYGIYDEDVLATMIGAHRLETGYGTSKVYLNYNNCGGVMQYNNKTKKMEYIKSKTFEIGAISFVKTFVNIMNSVLERVQNNEEGFDINKSLAYNMDPVYCAHIPEEGPRWYQVVDELKLKVIESGMLADYVKNSKQI